MYCAPSIAARLSVWLLAVACARAAAGADAVAIVAIDADPGHFNPAITTGSHVHAVADSLFNGLVGLDQNQQPMPDLATGWQVSPDGLTYTFTLAEALWHDGEPFTSADVKFTFENVLLKHHARTRAGLGALIAGIDANTKPIGTGPFRLARYERDATIVLERNKS